MHSLLEKKKGFTLIELLVVISIIGLLSSIVLSTLSTARNKARDASNISTFVQYTNAIELYYSENGKYPSPSNGIDSTLVCLGVGNPGGQCGDFSTVLQDAGVNTMLVKYIPGPPASIKPIISSINGTNVAGIIYSCYGVPSYDCTKGYQLFMYIENGLPCPRGAFKTVTGSVTQCMMRVY
jgi:prepilin-type N-terminal cleavage/methylation domain-containing protein